jgi:transcription antitermination factor NusG
MYVLNPGEWLAIQVWSGRESTSAEHLSVRGYEVFLPRYQERRRWCDRVKIIDRALFDGYLFCRAEENVVGAILSTRGVIRIVGPVLRTEVEALQRLVSLRLPAIPWHCIGAGTRVRIVTGPLQGVEGMVLRLKNHYRLILSVSALQRSVAVEIDSDSADVVNHSTSQQC